MAPRCCRSAARVREEERSLIDIVDLVPPLDAGRASLTAPPDKVPLRIRATAGAGQLVESVVTTVFGVFLFFYYKVILGVPGSLVGAATTASLAIEALVDPLLGSWSDGLRSRWGRRTPFMAAGAPMVALALAMAFTPPEGLPEPGLFAWLLASSLALRFGVSAFHVPFIALGAELSNDYVERSSVVAWRTLYSIFGPLAVLTLAYGVFLGGRLGLRNAGGYAPLGWTSAAVVLAGGWAAVIGVRRFAASLPMPPAHGGRLHARFVRELAEIFANPSFRVLFACAILFYAAQGVSGSLGQYMNLFLWKVSSAQILAITLFLFAGLMTGVPAAPLLARRMEKRGVVISGLFLLCLAQGGLTGLRAFHLVSFTGEGAVLPLGLNSFMAGFVLTLAGVSIASMMADAADEHDLLFAMRREGLYFAGLSFAGKAATGAVALVAGLALDATGFPRSSAVTAAAKPLPGALLDCLDVVAGPAVAAGSLVATMLRFLYRIDRRRHAEIAATLRERAQGAG